MCGNRCISNTCSCNTPLDDECCADVPRCTIAAQCVQRATKKTGNADPTPPMLLLLLLLLTFLHDCQAATSEHLVLLQPEAA